jgi:hypothetical protein
LLLISKISFVIKEQCKFYNTALSFKHCEIRMKINAGPGESGRKNFRK